MGECWVEDINNLAEIAKEDPQAALSAYNVGLCKRWTFLQRTVHDISELFQQLEKAISENLIPTICGRLVTEDQRRILSLPYRYGGLGIRNPVKTADREYTSSLGVTESLTNLICQQNPDITKLDREKQKEKKKELSSENENEIKKEFKEICERIDEKTKRLLL